MIQREPIAIIGIGCRFPGAESPQKFWQLLREGKNAIREVPADRWKMDQLYDPQPSRAGKMLSKWGGFIDNIDQFDWQAFRISPHEAKYIDPQHRLLLEVTWEALEDAGLSLAQVAGTQTGVFQGISSNDYLNLQERNWSKLDGYTLTGNAATFAANRISYCFDLKGPSITLNLACVSSLVAVHYACQSLWTGETNLAIAGGVNLMLSPDISIMLSLAGLLSPDGRCKTLDEKADGFVRGEGAGCVILKPLSQVSCFERIYALIRGSAVNHNGHNEWIMAASPTAQEAVIRSAFARSDMDLSEVDYIELHGTGLPKGDPIEAQAVGTALNACTKRKHSCRIGSVKTNIGHLEAAAGIAGLIKTALSLYHREIPPTLHLDQPHSGIAWETLALKAPQAIEPWPEKDSPHVAGVTAISLAGVNAHAVLEAFAHPENKQYPEQTYLLPLSARSPQALLELVQKYQEFLTYCPESLYDICYTASLGRTHHEYRCTALGHSAQSLIESLSFSLEKSSKVSPHLPRLVFVLPAQISAEWTLESSLWPSTSLLRMWVEQCQTLIAKQLDLTAIPQTSLSQIHLFALQVALVKVWQILDITPNGVIASGIGQIAADYALGYLSLEDAIWSLFPALKSDNPLTDISEAIAQQLQQGSTLFLELAPYPILTLEIAQSLEQQGRQGTVLAALEAESGSILPTLSVLYTLGFSLNWSNLFPEEGRCVSLPTYPWQRERLWLDWLDPQTISTPPEQALIPTTIEDSSSPMNRQSVSETEPIQQQQLLERYLGEQIALALGRSVGELELERPLNQLGLDSILALEIKHRVESSLQVNIPVSHLLEGWNVEQIVTQVLVKQLSSTPSDQNEPLLAQQTLHCLGEDWEEFKL